MGKRKRAAAVAAMAAIHKEQSGRQRPEKAARHARDPAATQAKREIADDRRARKLEHRRRDRKTRPKDAEWALPAPSGLVGRLERPKVVSKHKSYFEFADNSERKDKKLEFQVTNDPKPPPGFKFIPVGNPTLTDACKEVSREREAMYFIVSSNKEANDRVYKHISRIGYHFRESIVNDAADNVGDTVVSRRVYKPNEVEPIPKSQFEINRQADAAIRDLFPRIPNTDRQMIIDHAFKMGALFHGQPTVGLAADIPLSRRVQLAVLAHIRHTHTRYDLLLRETDWMSARKVVEPICLDIIVKWRGDEETGRDQLEEILREVVVITDSEEEEANNPEEDSSSSEEDDDEEGDDSGSSSSVSLPGISLPTSRNRHRSAHQESETPKRGQAQRGFQRYRAAWDQALMRQHGNPNIPKASAVSVDGTNRLTQPRLLSPFSNGTAHALPELRRFDLPPHTAELHPSYGNFREGARQASNHLPSRPTSAIQYQREQVTVRPSEDRPSQIIPRYGGSLSAPKVQPPPQVARASPPQRGLQDMLVPSIETASSDAVHDSRHREVHHRDGYLQGVAERHVQSPVRKQVIVINDSPPTKRRRVIYEEAASRLRSPRSRGQELHSAVPRTASYMPPPYVQSRDFLARNEMVASNSPKCFSRDVQPSMRAFDVGERLPVYDAPPESRYFTLGYDPYRQVGDGYGSIQQEVPPIPRQMGPQPRLVHSGESSYSRQPVNEDMRVVEHDRDVQNRTVYGLRDTMQRPLPTSSLVSSQASRSHEIGHDPTSSSNSSQFRVEPPLYRARDGFTDVPATSQSYYIRQDNAPFRGEGRPVESCVARPPPQYIERPMRIEDERVPRYSTTGQPLQERYQITERPPPLREHTPPEGISPVYVRTVRRPVIVLE